MSTDDDLAAAAQSLLVDMQRLTFVLANQQLIDTLDECSDEVYLDGLRWHDVTPMLSEHEHAPQVIDMHRACIAYALYWGVVQQHPRHPHLLRVTT